jgi:hypothetical protein
VTDCAAPLLSPVLASALLAREAPGGAAVNRGVALMLRVTVTVRRIRMGGAREVAGGADRGEAGGMKLELAVDVLV